MSASFLPFLPLAFPSTPLRRKSVLLSSYTEIRMFHYEVTQQEQMGERNLGFSWSPRITCFSDSSTTINSPGLHRVKISKQQVLGHVGFGSASAIQWKFLKFMEEPNFGPGFINTVYVTGDILPETLKDHCQWSSNKSCTNLLLQVKPGTDRIGPLVVNSLLKDSMQSHSFKLPPTLSSQFLRALHSVIIMLLIVSGWSNVKKYLYEVDLVFLKITATVQVLTFVATIVIESNPTDDIKNVKEIFLFVDFTSSVTVLLWFFRIYGLILMRELRNVTNEVKIMDTCVQMLRVNAITEAVSMIFYSLLFNDFNKYYVRVDQAAMFVLIKLNRQDVDVVN
ncbi:hypothetical protein L2E82_19569 [Cichorium intybus]|uniref:Uncharacterized protein n=1 Tax=Cichorium intybus TaxID=13427 RepID=A0ACB9FCB1_CICIN|nr:hypothetical protein L2E82_19569 [Cichorium intybus]